MESKIITPPTPIEQYKFDSDYARIFLAGSIEMDKADNWQNWLGEKLIQKPNRLILNPRRPDWDSTWKQSKDDANFSQQVNWELDGLSMADLVVFYFDPKTIAPISLFETGFCVGGFQRTRMIICCPEGYFRKGNIDVVCERFCIPQLSNLEDLPLYIDRHLHYFCNEKE